MMVCESPSRGSSSNASSVGRCLRTDSRIESETFFFSPRTMSPTTGNFSSTRSSCFTIAGGMRERIVCAALGSSMSVLRGGELPTHRLPVFEFDEKLFEAL